MHHKKIRCFLLAASVLFASHIAAAASIDTSIATFNDFHHDFAQSNFSLAKAVSLEIFLRTHEADLASHAFSEKGAIPFRTECDGAINTLQYLNQQAVDHPSDFKWSTMWSSTGENRDELYMFNADLTTMFAELNFNPNA